MSEGVEDQIRALTEQLQQLQGDNVKLHQEAVPQWNAAEELIWRKNGQKNRSICLRYVFLTCEHKCPRFSGTMGMGCLGVEEWVEEACRWLNTKYMTPTEQALFLYNHLEGEAKSKIRFHPSSDKNDPEQILVMFLETLVAHNRIKKHRNTFTFSHSLMALMEVVKHKNPVDIPDSNKIIRDHFGEHVRDCMLH